LECCLKSFFTRLKENYISETSAFTQKWLVAPSPSVEQEAIGKIYESEIIGDSTADVGTMASSGDDMGRFPIGSDDVAKAKGCRKIWVYEVNRT